MSNMTIKWENVRLFYVHINHRYSAELLTDFRLSSTVNISATSYYFNKNMSIFSKIKNLS